MVGMSLLLVYLPDSREELDELALDRLLGTPVSLTLYSSETKSFEYYKDYVIVYCFERFSMQAGRP
jgi:hypothetical protein